MQSLGVIAQGRLAPRGRFVLAAAASVGASLGAAYVLMSPEYNLLLAPLALALVLVIALALTPTTFLVVSFLAFATLQLTSVYTVSLGPATAYGSDMIVGIVLVRALLPRDRVNTPKVFGPLTIIATTAWMLLMLGAAVRGLDAGTSLDNVVRLGMAAIYWPLLYFGFSRTFREREFDIDRFFGALAVVGVGLVAYMLMMRALNRPFEPPDQIGKLGEVVASSGTIYRRDFGFWSAFIVYPAIAILAISRVVYERDRILTWITVAGICVIATLLTLIRGEIFGLVAGIAAVLVLSGRFQRGSRVVEPRRSAVIAVAALLVAVGAVVTIADRGFATIVSERSVGAFGAAQSAEARSTREVRVRALEEGRQVAGDHVFGLGLRSLDDLQARGIHPEYLAHSGYTTMLVYVGWPGLIAGLLVIIGFLLDSARNPARRPWLHPMLGGVLVLLLVYAFGAAGPVGEEHVMSLGALFVAARFALVGPGAEV